MARFDSDSRLSRELLEQLYNGERLTIDEIAHRLGCGATTIARALRAHGFIVRSKRDYRLEISRDALEQLYNEEGLTEDEIGQRFSCNGRTIGRRLEETGPTPAKSRTIGVLQIPDEVFRDFLRGALDGDGSWYISQHWGGRYRYLRVELCSASLCFVEWIRDKVEQQADLRGSLHENRRGHAYNLLYIGRKALALGDWIYYAPDLFALPRKRLVWQEMHSKQGELNG